MPKFAEVSAPLRPLLQDKGFRLPLTAEQIEAIQQLKAAMCDNVVMHHPDWAKMDTFEVHTDGSKRGIGGFLAQRIDGVLKPIRYVSRCTTKAEENYSAHELEVLAALYVIEASRSYLIGTTFKLVTDHSSLKWLLDSGASDRCGRQVRWLMRLSTFNFTVHHMPGKTHHLPDFLSRNAHQQAGVHDPEIEPLHAAVRTTPSICRVCGVSCASRNKLFRTHLQSSEGPVCPRTRDEQHSVLLPWPVAAVTRHSTQAQTRAVEKEQKVQEDVRAQRQHKTIQARRVPSSLVENTEEDVPHVAGDPILNVSDHSAVPRLAESTGASELSMQPDGMIPSPDAPLGRDGTVVPGVHITPERLKAVEDLIEKIDPTTDLRRRILEAQQRDPKIQEWFRKANDRQASLGGRTCTCANDQDEGHRATCEDTKYQYVARDGLLYQRHAIERFGRHRLEERYVVPEELKLPLLHYFHSFAHAGKNKVLDALSKQFYWKNMADDVRRWTRSCLKCCLRKTPQPKRQGRHGTLSAGRANEYVYADIVGPLNTSQQGNMFVLTITDAFTHWAEAVPIPDTQSDTIAEALFATWISRYGCMQYFVADNARYFTSECMENIFRVLRIRRLRVPEYLPQRLGFVERFHRYLGAALTLTASKYKHDWDTRLPMILFGYRTAAHAGTGISPYQATFARHPIMPLDLSLGLEKDTYTKSEYLQTMRKTLKEVWAEIRTMQEKQAQRNQRKDAKESHDVTFEPGDWVLIWCPQRAEKLPRAVPRVQKLCDAYLGPFKVTSVHNKSVIKYFNTTAGKQELAHVNRVAKWVPFANELPSEHARPRISKAERREMNKQNEGVPTALKDPDVGDLVAFPRLLTDPITGMDTPGFGVGRVLRSHEDQTYQVQWYGNLADKLLGRYHPCWSAPGSSTFEFGVQQGALVPYTNEDTATGVHKAELADVGFKLTSDLHVPQRTLEKISAHPSFQWKLHPI